MTGTICSVAICKSNSQKAKKSGEKIMFFRFPKNEKIRKEWIRKCHRNDKFNPENKRICNKHFVFDDFKDGMQAKLLNVLPRKLKDTAVPSLRLLPNQINQSVKEVHKSERIKRSVIEQHREKLIAPSVDSVTKIEILPSTSHESPYEILERNFNLLLEQNNNLRKKIKQNENTLALLQEKNLKLQKVVEEYEGGFETQVKELFADFLTPNQLDMVMKKKNKAKWNSEEISKAFTLRYFSKRAYIYLRQILKYPLPGILTLQRWAANLDLKSGILKDILNVMNLYSKHKNERQKVTVLSFNDVKVSSIIEYDEKEDEMVGPYSYIQVIMARGLFDTWKQPVFIGFDTKVTKSLLEEVITELYKVNYNVVSCVSDCEGDNIELWKELNISINKTYCFHPVSHEKIYFFADAAYLLKLIRNRFIDTGFCLKDGTVIRKEPIAQLIECTRTEVNSCHKLSHLHLNCEKAQRQNIALATELFSHTTATALKRYQPGDNKQLAKDVGDFVSLINYWFDNIMNSYTPVALVPTKQSYGKIVDDQNKILEQIKEMFKSMHCISKTSLEIFQKSVIVSCISVQDLYNDLTAKYETTFILTHRLNQDCLENLFSQIRTWDGLDDHPSPLSALYRIRMILLGKNPGMDQKHTNVLAIKELENEEYVLASTLKQAHIKVPNLDESAIEIKEELEDNISTTSSYDATSFLLSVSTL